MSGINVSRLTGSYRNAAALVFAVALSVDNNRGKKGGDLKKRSPYCARSSERKRIVCILTHVTFLVRRRSISIAELTRVIEVAGSAMDPPM